MRLEPLALATVCLSLATVTACEPQPDPTPTPQAAPFGTPAPAAEDRAPGPGLAELTVLRRYADDLARTSNSVRAHAADLRAAPPEQAPQAALRVSAAVDTLRTLFEELTPDRPMGDTLTLRLLGMSADDHRTLVLDLSTLRIGVEEILAARTEDLAARRDAVLAVTDRMLDRTDRTVEHMRATLEDPPALR